MKPVLLYVTKSDVKIAPLLVLWYFSFALYYQPCYWYLSKLCFNIFPSDNMTVILFGIFDPWSFSAIIKICNLKWHLEVHVKLLTWSYYFPRNNVKKYYNRTVLTIVVGLIFFCFTQVVKYENANFRCNIRLWWS